MFHELCLHHLIFNWSFIVFDTHQKPAIDANRLFFDCRSTGAPHVLDASVRNSPRARSRPISCGSMARLCWSLVTKHVWPSWTCMAQHTLTEIFKLFHARWAGIQRACLLKLFVVHRHECHLTIATFAGFDTAPHSASVDLQIVTWMCRCVFFFF